MALKFPNATLVATATLSNGTNRTCALWFRRAAVMGSDDRFFSLNRQIGWTTAGGIAVVGITPSPTYFPASGEWTYLAMQKVGNNVASYAFEDLSAETLKTLEAPSYAPTTVSTSKVGDVGGIYGTGPVDAEYVHWRAWDSVLTTAQLNAEKNSATPVITSGLLLNAPLLTDLTALTGTSPTITTGSGNTFTANLPLVLSVVAGLSPPPPDSGRRLANMLNH